MYPGVDKKNSHYDFHIHSNYSYDSLLTPDKIIKIAIKKRLDGIAITDHDNINGGISAARIAREKNKDLQVIVGEEIRTEIGDVIGLFLYETIKSKNFFDAVKEIKDQGGLVVLPHPFKSMDAVSPEIIKNIDLIECLNGHTDSMLNRRALRVANDHHIPAIGGSDAHFGFEIGKVKVSLYDICEPITKDILCRVLTNNNYEITGKPTFKYLRYLNVGVKVLKTKRLVGGYR